MITRSEAAHKLKCAISKLNHAVSAINDGRWIDADKEIWSAQDELDKLQPYIDEAAGMPMSRPVTSKPYPEPVSPRSVGSLAYGAPPPYGRTSPPPPLKKTPTIDARPPAPLKAKPASIITPPPAKPPIITAPPEKAPIITAPPEATPAPPPEPPPPPKYEPARVSIFPVEYDDVPPTTFDLSRMTDPKETDPEVLRLVKLFDSLPADARAALLAQHQRTGKPVICKIRTT